MQIHHSAVPCAWCRVREEGTGGGLIFDKQGNRHIRRHSIAFVVIHCAAGRGNILTLTPSSSQALHFLSLMAHFYETITPRSQEVVRLLSYLHTSSRQTHLGRRIIAPRLEFEQIYLVLSSLLSRFSSESCARHYRQRDV